MEQQADAATKLLEGFEKATELFQLQPLNRHNGMEFIRPDGVIGHACGREIYDILNNRRGSEVYIHFYDGARHLVTSLDEQISKDGKDLLTNLGRIIHGVSQRSIYREEIKQSYEKALSANRIIRTPPSFSEESKFPRYTNEAGVEGWETVELFRDRNKRLIGLQVLLQFENGDKIPIWQLGVQNSQTVFTL
jgi:hypothetical protein